MDCQQIVLFTESHGDIVAQHLAYGDTEGEYFQSSDGSIHYRNIRDPNRPWHVNSTLEAFRMAATAFNHYCACGGQPRSESSFLEDAKHLQIELYAIERPSDSDTSYWRAILQDIDAGNL